jgi:hypothetical protein
MLDHRLAASLHTDNRLVSNTTVCREIRMAADGFDFTRKQMKDTVLGAFKSSFFPKDYIFKRNYVRRVMNYYEELEKEYGVPFEKSTTGRPGRNDSFVEHDHHAHRTGRSSLPAGERRPASPSSPPPPGINRTAGGSKPIMEGSDAAAGVMAPSGLGFLEKQLPLLLIVAAFALAMLDKK